ncbi:MAG TPA: hypothetical protein VK783_15395 [Bacteroidia bacterium]|jgi:hypothetical protein|nr:hypothetical protein [Bacteroidia bacterium]
MKYIIITILALLSTYSSAQQYDSLPAKLLHQEMVYWQAQSDSVKFMALFTKAVLYKKSNKYNDALNELFRAEKFCAGKKNRDALQYETMLNYFLSGKYNTCSEIAFDSTPPAIYYNNYILMKLYSLNETEKWSACKELMIQQCTVTDTLLCNRVKQLPIGYNYKNPEKCRRLSSILPGLGETYAGYPFKGFTSFILNAGFLVFTGYNIYTGYYVTGVISGFFPFIKFHAGGKRLSAILADEHNEKESGILKKKYWEDINSIAH